MPRPPRRAAQPRDTTTTTPTRPATTTNAITAAIPPFMLETPPHAPFVTTPHPPSNNPGNSIVPEANAPRNRNVRIHQHTHTPTAANGAGSTQDHVPEQSQESTNALGSTMSEGPADDQSLLKSVTHDPDDALQLVGLREISSLATWTLSSSKPGCALAQLRHPSPALFWQSDGPQPHTLTLHFFKLVAIVKLRIYLNFELDESYTPTKMRFFAGMSEGGLVEFGTWAVQETTDPETGETHSGIEGVQGWVDVPLKGVGGRDTRYHDMDLSPGNVARFSKRSSKSKGATGREWSADAHPTTNISNTAPSPDKIEAEDEEFDSSEFAGGDVLKAMVVQVRICENHQNGKDTHVRGFQVFARDEISSKELRKVIRKGKGREGSGNEDDEDVVETVGLQPADWMRDPEIR